MSQESEIRHLLDVMPASGRMLTQIISQPGQRAVIAADFPMPWVLNRPISINFELWSRLSRPQQDLALLHTVAWLTGVRWFQPNLFLGLAIVGGLGALVEGWQQDAIGLITATGLGTIALAQLWRQQRSSQRFLAADEQAIQVALRRGYQEQAAAQHLIGAIEAIAQNEGRSLTFVELLRCQALRPIAGWSAVGIPEALKREEF